jgi:DNA-binding NarL/FixJ family response regulator
MHALLISDNSSIRDAITVLMGIFHPGSRVICAINILEIHSILETRRIDVAFMDAATAGFSDRAAANALEYRHPDVRVLVLGPGANRKSLIELLDAASPAPPPRRSPMDSFLHALRGIVPPIRPATSLSLTARQSDVLRLLREGRSTKEIARQLGLAVPTVKTHLAALYRLLGARNRVEAVMKPVGTNSAAAMGMAREFPEISA